MQGFATRKKTEEKLMEEEKKKQPMAPGALSMSEGPMILADSSEVERHGRLSFENSVKVELKAMGGKKGRKGKKKGKRRVKKIKIR